MTALLRISFIWVLGALAILVLSGWLQYNGFQSDAGIRLWSKAILQVDGPASFKSSDALYPPLPFVVSMMAHGLIGAQSIPVPTLVSAAVVGLLIVLWYENLILRGSYTRQTAALIIVLVVSNPLFLFSISDAPEMAFLCLGAWIFARGIVHLRLNGNAPDMMKVAVGLLIIGLSSSYGILIALASVPFMALAARPSLLVASPTGYVLAMIFPVICAVGSLLFIGAIFNTPLIAPTYSVSHSTTLSPAAYAYLIGVCPTVVCALRMWRIPSHAVPLMCASGTIGGAMALDFNQGLLGDPLLAAAPLVVIGVVGVRFWPQGATRAMTVLLVLGFSWIAAYQFVAGSSQANAQRWILSVHGTAITPKSDTLRVAEFLRGRDGIMVDAERHPDLIVALGGIAGLVVAGSPDYEMVLFGGKPNQAYIVVNGEAGSPVVRDRVLRRFPGIAAAPPRGYALVFQQGEWMVFERQKT